MLSLTSGTFVEDFDYGYPYDQLVPPRPPEFDYAGKALTSQGWIISTPHTFTLEYGSGADNADAGLPYGGAESTSPGYLRWPVLSWNHNAGLFLTVTTTAAATLTFDRSFSGYVGDRFIVSINDIERLSVTGSAGYAWTRNTLTLPKGTSRIAFLLITAPYTGTGVVREGISQGSSAVTEISRYLRLTNLSVTNVKALPAAANTRATIIGHTVGVWTPSLSVTSGRVSMRGQSKLLCPMVISGPVTMRGTGTLSADNAFVGKIGSMTVVGNSTMAVLYALGAYHSSDGAGFSIATTASLMVSATVPENASALLRSLKKTSVVMDTPLMSEGTPQNPIAACISEVTTSLSTAQVIRRVDPYAPANVVPVTPTWRWLSLDAEVEPTTNQLTQWHPTQYSGPVWSTPGDYRPTVGQFAIKRSGQVFRVNYPSVQFDAAHLDHLNLTMPYASVHPQGRMTWIFVGSFTRYRGKLTDNSPILDFGPTTQIDYGSDQEYTAIRGDFMPWVDSDTASSIYLGLTNYSDKDPTSSRFAYRLDDAAGTFGRTEDLVITDATPVVLIYKLDTVTSSITVTPLVAGQGGSTTSKFARINVDGFHYTFSLGKARVLPPYAASFLTGSMSLLEVAYFGRDLTDAEITSLQSFYVSLYSPVAGDISEPDYTVGAVTAQAEQVLVYAADPETPLVLLSGGKAVPLGVYPSTSAGRIEIDRFNQQGVPTVKIANRDYSQLLAYLEGS